MTMQERKGEVPEKAQPADVVANGEMSGEVVQHEALAGLAAPGTVQGVITATGQEKSAPLQVMEYALPEPRFTIPLYRRIMTMVMGGAGGACIGIALAGRLGGWVSKFAMGDLLLVGSGLIFWAVVIRWQHVQFHLWRRRS